MVFVHLLWENKGAEKEQSGLHCPLKATYGHYGPTGLKKLSKIFFFLLNEALS